MESSALKMLAEVASAELQSDPTLYYKTNERRNSCSNTRVNNQPTRKSSSERLTLEQIRALSDKMLIEMFSELICDEMRKNYSFKCYLIPDRCSQIFKSFGNETRARCKMKAHLQSHINDLISEYEGATDSIFTAEPLYVRRKRQELNEKSVRKRKKSKQMKPKRKTETSVNKLCNNEINDFNFESQNIAIQNSYHSSASNYNCDYEMCAAMNNNQNVTDVSNMHLPVFPENSIATVPQYTYTNYLGNQSTGLITLPESSSSSELHTKKKYKRERTSSNSTVVSYDVKWNADFDNAYLNNSSVTDVKDNDYYHSTASFHHDHTYTSIEGVTFNSMVPEECKSSVSHTFKDNMQQDDTDQSVVIPTPPFPYVYSPMLPFIAEIKEVESILIPSGGSAEYLESSCENTIPDTLSAQTAYEKDLQGYDFNDLSASEGELITEDDENTSSADSFIDDLSENDSYSESNNGGILNSTFIVDDILETDCPPNLQSVEKKLAMKFIRALRIQKKDERGPLVCRICKNKSFTAQATLMYHYRSHAGIKPFSCAVCEATFTRQHSLNYHMLIHNNKSRFVCGDCGRTFRHPSHYKEHLRRHTGETPYQCPECKFRFKTRNTYKRHLKTRHGKILSAEGIHSESIEFYQEATISKPKHHDSPDHDESYKTRWSEILFSEDFSL